MREERIRKYRALAEGRLKTALLYDAQGEAGIVDDHLGWAADYEERAVHLESLA
jgi:hypothetical protein